MLLVAAYHRPGLKKLVKNVLGKLEPRRRNRTSNNAGTITSTITSTTTRTHSSTHPATFITTTTIAATTPNTVNTFVSFADIEADTLFYSTSTDAAANVSVAENVEDSFVQGLSPTIPTDVSVALVICRNSSYDSTLLRERCRIVASVRAFARPETTCKYSDDEEDLSPPLKRPKYHHQHSNIDVVEQGIKRKRAMNKIIPPPSLAFYPLHTAHALSSRPSRIPTKQCNNNSTTAPRTKYRPVSFVSSLPLIPEADEEEG